MGMESDKQALVFYTFSIKGDTRVFPFFDEKPSIFIQWNYSVVLATNTCKFHYLLYESIREGTRASLRKTRDCNPRYSVTALACPGWIYARPRDKDDSDNTVLLRLPAGVPPSFLIPHGTADFVRSYRCWWFQVSPLKRRHNGDPRTCRRKCAGGTFAPEEASRHLSL